MVPPDIGQSSHSALDIGHKTVTMVLFHRGKGALSPEPTTIEEDRLSWADAGFWGASVCLWRLQTGRKHLRSGAVRPV